MTTDMTTDAILSDATLRRVAQEALYEWLEYPNDHKLVVSINAKGAVQWDFMPTNIVAEAGDLIVRCPGTDLEPEVIDHIEAGGNLDELDLTHYEDGLYEQLVMARDGLL